MQNNTVTKAENQTVVRPPIVVVMGHIDHGKTSILDWYRNTKVVEKESGGITQHIGAYEVIHEGRRLTFIDTPGHEAFSKLRGRGAKTADVAVLVIAADEGVKPQTKEALEAILQYHLPFVIALNKIDKESANPERVRQELAKENILVESYGGQIPMVEVSAKTGAHMDELLETIILLAALDTNPGHPEKPAEGIILEAHRDPRRGLSASLLILTGTLKKGDPIVIARTIETVKILEDFLGHPITTAGPSSPVQIAGLSALPPMGEQFLAFPAKEDAQMHIKNLPPAPQEHSDTPKDKEPLAPGNTEQKIPSVFTIILKADVTGSEEALSDALRRLNSDAIRIEIIKSEVGDINESDVKLALATHTVTIIGFKVRVDTRVRELIRHSGIHVITGDVIYQLLDAVGEKMRSHLPPETTRVTLGTMQVLKLFKKENGKQIVGGRVEEGTIKKGVTAEILRGSEILGTGIIRELQRERTPVEEIGAGGECGIMLESKTAAAPGDTLRIYEEKAPA